MKKRNSKKEWVVNIFTSFGQGGGYSLAITYFKSERIIQKRYLD